jgi:hypothetical protein
LRYETPFEVEDCDAGFDASADVHHLPSSEQNSHSIELTTDLRVPNIGFAFCSGRLARPVQYQHTATRLPGR